MLYKGGVAKVLPLLSKLYCAMSQPFFFPDALSLLLVCTVVIGVVKQWLWEVVVGGSGGNTCAYESGRKGSNRFKKLPVLEYEQVTCWFRVGLLDL